MTMLSIPTTWCRNAIIDTVEINFRGETTSLKLGSRVLLPFYRKKLDRSTQFGAFGYIIIPYSSKSYGKSWGSVQIWEPGPPNP